MSALLLVHGFTDSGETWSALRATCARRGQHTAAIDLPGLHRGPDRLVPVRGARRLADSLGDGELVVLARISA